MSELITILSNGEPVFISQLKTRLHCDAAAVFEQLIALQQQGIQLEINEQQVKLIPQLPLLNKNYLAAELSNHQLFIAAVLPSTNQFLLDNIHQLENGAVCLAEYQSAGRGRRGRAWLSPFAGQIIMSLYWTFPRTLDLNGLSLVVGVAIAETLTQAGASHIQLKWPNDILLQGRKLAGILLEIANKNNGLHNIIIGVGINLSLGQQTKQIDQPWAELVEVLPTVDRNQLIVQLVRQLTLALATFADKGIDATFQQKWAAFDAFLGEKVNIISENRHITGIENGIDSRGYLQLLTEQGMQYFNGGEVSLRKTT